MKIMTGTKKRIDEKAARLNYSTLEKEYKISFVNYLHTQLYKNYKNKEEGLEDILRKHEFMGINTTWEQELHHGKKIIRDIRRRRGLPRKEQL